MKTVTDWIVGKIKKSQMSPIERYLANSVDLVDLERRQNNLMYKREMTKYGYWV